MARAFAERGMKLALIDIDAKALDQAAASLRAEGVQVLTFTLDITDVEQLRQAATETARQFGGINIVCANAGVTGFLGPLQQGSDADWSWIIDVNIKGSVNTVQATLPWLLRNEHDAHIVITSSISGLRVHKPSRGQGMYNTTKYAMVGLAEALALDLEPHGIGVSVLCPGVVNTDISNSGRNRQARYGGACTTAGEDFVLAKAAKSGTDPLVFGRWVRKAIERQQFYVITHPQDRDQVEARHARILQGFDACAELTSDAGME
jgi:NAD(P)-dependent dehydrogenase (short-subunit alcohol dehydrogenase family)